MNLDTSSVEQLGQLPFQAEENITFAEVANDSSHSHVEIEWPYSFKADDPRLSPGVSRVGWIKDMDMDKIYSADTDTVLLYCQEKTPGLNAFADSMKDSGNPVLLEASCWCLIEKMFPDRVLPFKAPRPLFNDDDVIEQAIDSILDISGATNASEKTRNDLEAMFMIRCDTAWDYDDSIDQIMLCNDYEFVKLVYKDIERFLQVSNLIGRFSLLPYAIRFVTKSGLFVDFPHVLKSFKMPDTVEQLIERSIKLRPPYWGIRDGAVDVFFDESLPISPAFSMTLKPELPPISMDLTSHRLDRNQSCLGRVSEMGHDHFYFIDSGLLKRFMTGEIPGFNAWVRENKRLGFGVHVHPISAAKIEAEFGQVPDDFVVMPITKCPSKDKLISMITDSLSQFDVEFAKLPEITQESLILFKQVDRIFWKYLDKEKGIHALLLTEDFETSNYIYLGYQSLAELYDSMFTPIADFRLIHPSGFYADFENWNQDFQMEPEFENFVKQCETAEPRFVFGPEYEARLKRVAELKGEFDPKLF